MTSGPTHTSDWVFDLGKPERPRLASDGELVNLIGETDRWQQFENDLIYELDCLVRDFIKENSKHAKWKTNRLMRRYTMSMVYELVYGRKYDHMDCECSKVNYWLPRILAYYSTKVQKSAYINGKLKNKTVYTLSPKRINRPPYSLRLRLEWFAEQGVMPTYSNMCLPKDNLKAGHARNPKTDRNMELRRERARARYRERYQQRDH